MDLKQLKDEELCALLEKNESPKEQVLVELISRQLGKDILCYLLEYLKYFHPSSKIFFFVWDSYAQQGLNNFELGWIIRKFPVLRTEAVIRLCGRPLETEDLKAIMLSRTNYAEANERLKELRAKKLKTLEVIESDLI